MGKILLLSDDVINKIAAGEVVERPKNVIKELVENSIDAKSTKIVITIKNGGKDYMSVADNGSGILKEDIPNAFLPHATSKIKTDDDLYSVLSLGFRGEALASISAVAKTTLTTKTEQDNLGTKISVFAGEVVEEKEVSFNTGTLIEVEDIFSNIPARQKFLKKAVTESSVITEFIQKIAICYPNIAFKFINNSTTILETTGNGDIKEVFYRIYGKDVVLDSKDIAFENDEIIIKGLICKGSTYRANRNYENFYINNRIVKSNVLRKAVEDAYKGRLPIGKHPVFAINFDIKPTEIDINVHPSKEEVRFSNEEEIYEALYNVVSNTLSDDINIPKAKYVEKNKPLDIVEEVTIKDINIDLLEKTEIEREKEKEKLVFADSNDFNENKTYIDIANINFKDEFVEKENIEKKDFSYTEKPIVNNKDSIEYTEIKKEIDKPVRKSIYANKFFNNVNIVGQIFDTYWIIEADSTSYIIDQHSAHEKILYEEYMDSFRNRSIDTQIMLMPISLILNESESIVLEENMELFNKLGFDVETFGKNTYAIREIPFVFETITPSFFMDLLENIKSLGKNIDSLSEMYEEKIISMSCKAAVKANDKLSFADARVIIEKLTKLENPFNCPHGRPTIVELSKSEIEKMFKRVL